MTEKQFEAYYYDEYMKQWTVRNVETRVMYPLHQKTGQMNLLNF